MEFLGIQIPFTAKKETKLVEAHVPGTGKTEAERLARLKAERLAERTANSRTQPGSGAGSFRPVNAPSTEGTGTSSVTALAQEDKIGSRITPDDERAL